MKFLLLAILMVGIAMAQAPITFSGTAGQSGGHFNPGVSVALPVLPTDSLPFEWNHVPGYDTFLVGINHTVVGFNNYKSGITFSATIGVERTALASHFATAYTVGYYKHLNDKWSIGPSIRYGGYTSNYSVSESLGLSYAWRRK